MQRVLADPKVSIYLGGRNDIQTGQIDRRILAVMEYLVAKGYRLTITSLKCGHSYLTSSGNVSAHSYGSAVDIAAVNGIPIIGHQGPGSITEAVIKDLLLLQGTMRPAQIISLMELAADLLNGGPQRPHPRRLQLDLRQLPAARRDPQGRAVAAPDPAPRGDPEPKGPSKPSDAALPAKGRSKGD